MKTAGCFFRLSLGAMLAFAVAKGGQAQMVVCEPMDHQRAIDLVHGWSTALQSGDAGVVADQYFESSILLATYRAEPLISRQQKMDYFSDFLKKKPVMRLDSEWSDIGCNSAVVGGVYGFSLFSGEFVRARYLFAFRFEGGRWLIGGHHSSVLPY